MKKLATIALLSASFPLFAQQSIHIVSPVGSTGAVGKMTSVIHPQLEKRGWDVKYEALGNCAAANAAIKKSDSIIYYWSPELFAYDETHTCYQPAVTEKELVTVMYNGPYFVCSVGANKDLFDVPKGTKIKLGTGAVGNPPEHIVKAVMDKTQANVTIVNYANTRAIEAGVVAGEVDFILSSNGNSLEKRGLVSCQHNTAGRVVENSKPLMNNGTPIVIQSGMYLSSKGISNEVINKLRSDITDIMQGPEFKTFIEGRGAYTHATFTTKPEQVKFLDELRVGYKK